MKISALSVVLTLCSAPFVHAVAVPDVASDSASLALRDASAPGEDSVITDLWKRRGGGGSGSRGGSSSGGRSGSSRGSSSRGSSSRGSSSRGGSSSSSGNRGSSSSRSGSGSSSSSSRGTGSPRTFGGGNYYAGGAAAPYRSGTRSAAGLPAAFFAIGLLSFWPALWLTNAYLYNYPGSFRYNFHNQSSNANESLPVVCACAEYSLCGCDENNSTTYLDSLVGNGSYSGLNSSVVGVANVNGTKTLLVNGTLSNDTTVPSEDEDEDSNSMALMNTPTGLLGYWPVALAAFSVTYLL
ncbi:hypothetical protein BROUX41_005078 [Berkeleyomyces rouxiae]|uniref:uncharacterized protein n=1 Tax=Berkeleyomyces rouxiae TaxID=2035830 RepID=UPI003B7F034D